VTEDKQHCPEIPSFPYGRLLVYCDTCVNSTEACFCWERQNFYQVR